ncbi:MAG: HAD-IB family phosphatase [Candidatus Thermoplasmatota archaeon]|nr:HAD-IB family phosphatase [Candidatus Thermoplasmatota archaeon]
MVDVYRMVAFDMDGVLVDMESSWSYIHKCFGTDNRKTAEAYLNGEIGSNEFMNRDIALWKSKGKFLHDIEKIFESIPVMKGIHECIGKLKAEGIITAIVSGGLDILARRIARDAGIDHVAANGIDGDMEKGILRVSPRRKDVTLTKLAEKLHVKRKEIISVGNSRYDIKMFEVSGMGIAFNPCDDEVIRHADVVIKGKNLSLILPYVIE